MQESVGSHNAMGSVCIIQESTRDPKPKPCVMVSNPLQHTATHCNAVGSVCIIQESTRDPTVRRDQHTNIYAEKYIIIYVERLYESHRVSLRI